MFVFCLKFGIKDLELSSNFGFVPTAQKDKKKKQTRDKSSKRSTHEKVLRRWEVV